MHSKLPLRGSWRAKRRLRGSGRRSRRSREQSGPAAVYGTRNTAHRNTVFSQPKKLSQFHGSSPYPAPSRGSCRRLKELPSATQTSPLFAQNSFAVLTPPLGASERAQRAERGFLSAAAISRVAAKPKKSHHSVPFLQKNTTFPNLTQPSAQYKT